MGIASRTVFFLPFILVTVFNTVECGLTCLRCDSSVLPILCSTVEKCGPHEICGLEQYVTPIGSIRYRQRCMDNLMCPSRKREVARREMMHRSINKVNRSVNSVICVSCCDSDLCNSAGCKQKGFDDVMAEHLCYNCENQLGPDTCDVIASCGRDQICQIVPLNIPGAPKNLFKTTCQHIQVCAAEPSIIGRKRSACHTCCNGTLCNDYDPTGSCADPATTTSTTVASSMTSSAAAHVVTTAATTSAPSVTVTTRSTSAAHVVTTTGTTSVPVSTVTTSTSQPVIPTAGSHSGTGHCTDVFATCPAIYCTLPDYKDWVHINCKKTCNLCSGDGTGSGFEPACNDTMPGCTDQSCIDYHEWSLTYCRKTCGYCKAHASLYDGNGWYLMLKMVAGVDRPTADILSIWASNTTLNSHVTAYADSTNTFHGHFKPEFSDKWEHRHYDQVNVTMYINGTEKAFITFNAKGLDKLSWFRADRVLDSTWAQLPRAGNFQINLDGATGLEFNADSGHVGSAGCDSTGWMTVVVNSNCVHDSKLDFPAFLFCPGPQPCRWRDKTYVSAEVFSIHGHTKA